MTLWEQKYSCFKMDLTEIVETMFVSCYHAPR